MADPKSTANRPLWLMAISLAVIAVCLVILVTRMHSLTQPDTKQTTPAHELKPGETEAKYVPAFARPGHDHVHAEPPAIAVQTAPVQANLGTDEDNPPLIPVVAKEPEPAMPAGGLVPISAPQTNAGVITGRVFLQGKPPPETPIHLDAFCGRVHMKPATTHDNLVSPDGGLANVFVYIEGGLQRKDFAVPAPAVVNQIGCEFVPSAIGVMSGQELIITNSDAHLHNVDAKVGQAILFNLAEQPSSFVEKRFSIVQNPKLMSRPISLKCDVHPWMEARVWVVDNPFFAVTDSRGNYIISNVPPGEYDLGAFHSPTSWSHFGKVSHLVVKQGETTNVDFLMDTKNLVGR